MKKVLLSVVAICSAIAGIAQTPNNQHRCAADHYLNEALNADPVLKAQHDSYMESVRMYLASNPDLGQKSGQSEPKIIPVVFHVIHDGSTANISDAQILDQLDIMNEDFRRLNADAANTPAYFNGLAADVNIEFRLANLDPDGNCTDGITRTQSPRTRSASNQNGVKDVIGWNCRHYLNVWIVNDIGLDIPQGGMVLGYAQFPLGGLCRTDGIVVRSDYIGSIGTATGKAGRTCTHEIGHYLGLRHIWGDAECGSDGILDTPVHKEANFGCFTYPKINDCGGADTVHGEMFMNYMDYSNDDCMNMFSKGQSDVMNLVTSTQPIGQDSIVNGPRFDLINEENMTRTGALNNPRLTCAPKAAFFGNRQMICEGAQVQYTDNSYNGNVSSRVWTFEGGNNTTSTQENPTITYANPGRYDVSLEVTNPQGTSTATSNDYVIVSSNTPDDVNFWYVESFESEEYFNNKWIVFNDDNEVNKWQRANVARDQFFSAYVNNIGNVPGAVEELISPSYDISNLAGTAILSYWFAGATRTNEPTDELRIFTSTNCGQSWQSIGQATLTGPELVNNGLVTSPFVPASTNNWTNVTVNLPSNVQNEDNVRIKFEFTAGANGNNFYLDQINISNLTSVNEGLAAQHNLTIYPNPTGSDGLVNVGFFTPQATQGKLEVIDVFGRIVGEVYNGNIAAGKNKIEVPRTMFTAKGVYFVRLSLGDKQITEKLLVTQ